MEEQTIQPDHPHKQPEYEQLLEWMTSNPGFLSFHGIDPDEPFTLSDFAHGECNQNYLVSAGECSFLLRRSLISQMHLPRQIAYEYHALTLLSGCKRTPRPYALVEPSTEPFLLDHAGTTHSCLNTTPPFAFLTMEVLLGRALSYETDLTCAAHILAEIHAFGSAHLSDLRERDDRASLGLPGFIAPRSPEQAMLDECSVLMERYLTWEKASAPTCALLRRLTRMLTAFAEKNRALFSEGAAHHTLINTELNSGNFLMGDPAAHEGFLVDWEKPLKADCAQDLGHFLAPTTTLWKTDTVLSTLERDSFIATYEEALRDYQPGAHLMERVHAYTALTCLRGVSWCAWAAAEYAKKTLPVDADEQRTFKATLAKINSYLSEEFLENLITAEVSS